MDIALAKLARAPEMSIEVDESSELGGIVPGTTLTGRVVLKKPLPSETDSFTISLLGSMRLYMSAGAYSTHDERHTLLELHQELPISPDAVEFPFSFDVPVDTIPSVKLTKRSHLLYELRAKIGRKGIRSDTTKKIELRILAARDLEGESRVSSVRSKIALPFTAGENPVSFDAAVPHDDLPRYQSQTGTVDNSPANSDSEEENDTASTVFDSSPSADVKTPRVQTIPVGPGPSAGPSSAVAYKLYVELAGASNALISGHKLPIRVLLYPTSPMPPLEIISCRVMLFQKTYTMLDGFRHLDRVDYELLKWRGERSVDPAPIVDFTDLLRDAILPGPLVPTFASRLVGRSYVLMVMLNFASSTSEITHRAVVRMPVKVIG